MTTVAADEPPTPEVGDVVLLRYSSRAYVVEAIEQTGLLRLHELDKLPVHSFYAQQAHVVEVIEGAPEGDPREALRETARRLEELVGDLQRSIDRIGEP